MQPKSLFAVSMLICLFLQTCVCVADELSDLSDSLGREITGSGKKKVAILDFTDLQSRPIELGRYVSEQLTVGLVSSKASFKVVDRANLKKILDEHKLTATGLVDPENAKKLGQISGVDALVIGTAAAVGDSIQLTAKVIATDTAEIVAASRGRLKRSEEWVTMLSPMESSPESKTSSSASPAQTKEVANSQTIGPLRIDVKSHNVSVVEGQGSKGTISFNAINVGKNEVLVSFHGDTYSNCGILNKRGEITRFNESSGITTGQGYKRDRIPISPGDVVRSVFKFWSALDFDAATSPPYQMQVSLDVAEVIDGRAEKAKTLNFLIDLK